MESLDQIANIIALTMGVAWASGINLYAAIVMLGIMGATGAMILPPDLQILANPLVIAAAGVMYLVEFVADKIPGVDTGWDSIHTFIRIPAGALLAMGAVGEVNPALSLAAAIMGGGMAAASHATKSGTRVLINTSPEPVTNWVASVTEDAVVLGGLWTAMNYPWAFIILLILFILLMIWLLPKLWKGIKKVFGAIGRLFGMKNEADLPLSGSIEDTENTHGSSDNGSDIEGKIQKLNDLLHKGLITQEECQKKKDELLERF